MDYTTLSDADLLGLLRTEEDRLPRAAVDEFVRRGDRMVAPLTAICKDPAAWDEEGPGLWATDHAVNILGAIGGERTLEGLLAALDLAVEREADWILEKMPELFGRAGPAAIPALQEKVAQGTEELVHTAFQCLGGVAAYQEALRSSVLDWIRAFAEDEAHDTEDRAAAASVLLEFVREGDRNLLMSWGKRMERDEASPLFFRETVEESYRRGTPNLKSFRSDWLDFYSAEAIESRRRERAQDEEGERWAKAAWSKEPWVREEYGKILKTYGESLSDLPGRERDWALETAQEMMRYVVESEASVPWRWDVSSAESCLMDAFVVEHVDDPENRVRVVPDHMIRFVAFWEREGKVPAEERQAIEKRLRGLREKFVHAVQHPEEWEQEESEPEFEDELAPDSSVELPTIRDEDAPPPPARAPVKIGRNDPCPCGSGKKYKRCCLE